MKPTPASNISQMFITSIQHNFPFFANLYIPLLIAISILVIIRAIFWYIQYRKLIKTGILTIDTMTSPEFEEYLIGLCNQLGYKVEHMDKSDDYGVACIIEQYGVRTAVQAKRRQHAVSEQTVKDVATAKNINHCSEALVLTNSHFTNAAKRLAKVQNVTLWDRKRLVQEMYNHSLHR